MFFRFVLIFSSFFFICLSGTEKIEKTANKMLCKDEKMFINIMRYGNYVCMCVCFNDVIHQHLYSYKYNL